MFKSARIKLTGAYLLIIMTVTVLFSSITYFNVTNFTQRAITMHDRRIEMRLREFPRGTNFPERFQAPYTDETVAQIKQNILFILITMNLAVLILSGAFAYWFAGKTLKPIEEMTIKQRKFIADASHELKTPLTAMKTQLEVNLRNKELTLLKARELLSSTIDDVDSLTLLTNSLLKQSRYQNYNNGHEMETFKIKELVAKNLDKFKQKIKEKNISVNLDVSDTEIFADKKSITELITILMDNAIKFNKTDGTIDISANKFNNNAELKFSDTGIGIEKNDLPHVFDRFYKAESSRTKGEQDGFGLGLSIAKEIVDQHKGTITIQSELSKGTIITVNLPQKN